MHIVAVTGGSGSGKSLVAEMLQKRLGDDRSAVVEEDCYYTDLPKGADPVRYNFDTIEAKERDLFYAHLMALQAGHAVEIPTYDFAVHLRTEKTIPISPKPIIIVEGSHVAYESRFRELFSCLVYIDTPDDIRLARRMVRDIVERKRSPQSVVDQYLNTVKPMQYRYTYPAKYQSDIVIYNEEDHTRNPSRLDRYIDLILDRIGVES